MGYIYKITNLISGNRYIGYTKNTVQYRFKQHIKNAYNPKRPLTKLGAALKHYNPDKDFKVEIIEECDNDKLAEREIYWIAHFNTYPNEYNMTPGGDGGKTIDTQRHREIFKNPVLQYDLDGNFITEYITSGEAAEKTNTSQEEINRCCLRSRNAYSANGFIWKKKNDDTPIEIWVKANKTKFNKRPIIQYDLDGNIIQEFPSIQAAGAAFNKKSPQGTIGEVCHGHQILAYGFIWRFKDDNRPLPTQEEIQRSLKSNKKRPILQYDLNNNFIQEFPSIAAAGKALNVKSPSSSIGEACRGKQKTSHGYIWKFKDEVIKEFNNNEE